ncbi:MAG TPA: HDOD domain-containing protein [Aeromonadales bacterium]|nr:HDOD domain-containing protein [Aeromonadales bacterium]
MENLSEKASKLFTLPSIVFQLQEMLYNQTSTAEEIGELIGLDPALTARILRLANSSFYSFPAQIDTVSRAVTIVGTNEIYNLALATAAVSTFRGVNSKIIDMPRFWRHSVYTGLFARNLLTQIGIRNAESVFVAGLLHNIGLLVLLEQAPEKVNEVADIEKGLPSWEKEQKILNFRLSEVSGDLLKAWNLPPSLCEPVFHQHHPENTAEEFQQSAACVYLGLRVASSIVYDCEYDYMGSLTPEAFALAGVDQENIAEAMVYADENVHQILAILCPEAL